jgi:hypothetical protein
VADKRIALQAVDDRVAIRLTQLPALLRAQGFTTVDYRVIRESAVNATIPVHQRNGLWQFYPEDAPAIAKALRLRKLPTAAVA